MSCKGCRHHPPSKKWPCEDCCDGDRKELVVTNYDRVISKTPEQLAEFIEHEPDRPWCTGLNNPCKYSHDNELYGKCWICATEWLNQEANE